MNRTTWNSGCFTISGRMVRNNPNTVVAIFSMLKIVTTHCKYISKTDVYDYKGESKHFLRVGKGGLVPRYEFKIIANNDGTIAHINLISLTYDEKSNSWSNKG